MSNQNQANVDPIGRAVKARLEDLKRAGVTHLKKGVFTPMSKQPSRQAAPESSPKSSQTDQLNLTVEAAGAELAKIQARVAKCRRCEELAEARTQTVFGDGNPRARLVFLGEAPGADEDRQGVPFVGRAGKLLDKILEACTLRREDIYILNILKCRPPGNRNPAPSEASNCREYLDAQLAVIQPEFICCMGAVATKNLLAVETPIGKMRGAFHSYNGIRVLCTYHPAYLLRNPAAKRDTWEDMKLLMGEMGIKL